MMKTRNMKEHNNVSHLWKFERDIYWMVSEKFSLKNSKFYKEYIAHLLLLIFCHPIAISQLLMADISLNISCKELKISQVGQVYQLFRLLNLVFI